MTRTTCCISLVLFSVRTEPYSTYLSSTILGRRDKHPSFAINAKFPLPALTSFRNVIVCAVKLQCGEENPPAIQMTTIPSEGPEPDHIHSEGPEPDQSHSEGPGDPEPFPVEVSYLRHLYRLLDGVRCGPHLCCGSGSNWAYGSRFNYVYGFGY